MPRWLYSLLLYVALPFALLRMWVLGLRHAANRDDPRTASMKRRVAPGRSQGAGRTSWRAPNSSRARAQPVGVPTVMSRGDAVGSMT